MRRFDLVWHRETLAEMEEQKDGDYLLRTDVIEGVNEIRRCICRVMRKLEADYKRGDVSAKEKYLLIDAVEAKLSSLIQDTSEHSETNADHQAAMEDGRE